MEYRLKKQITIASVFFSIIFLVLFAVFFTTKESPSCYDNKLNQKEKDVDCGGPCAPCVKFYFEDIEILKTGILSLGETYDTFAKIKNPNSQYGASKFYYSFKFYDKDGNYLKEEKGADYILSGQTKYIVKNNINISKKPSIVKFEIRNIKWEEQKRTNIKLPVFSKKYERITKPSSAVKSQVTGIIENQSNYSFVDVDIFVSLLDKDGNYISINKTNINNLRVGERRFIVVPWFENVDEKIAKIYIEASSNALDDSNILK